MQDRSLKNSFMRLPRPQQLIIIILLCGNIIFALECLSWLGIYVVWRVAGKEVIQIEHILKFQPFSRKNIFITRSEYKPYYLSGLIPNMKISQRTPFGTDRYGFLINDKSQYNRDLNLPSNAYRIFIYGNSTVMGNGSGRSLSAYLEAALNLDRSSEYEVVTAGGDGFNSGQELARLSLETLHYHPDMIITFDGVADAFWSSFSNNTRPNAHMVADIIRNSLNRSSLENKSLIEVNISSVDFFLRRFYSYNILLAVFAKIGLNITNPYNIGDQSIFRNNLVNTPVFRPEGAHVYIGNLKSMAAISNMRGIRSLHFLQPTLATELISRDSGATDAEWDLLETKNLKRSYSRRHRAVIFNQFYNLVRSEFARQANGSRNSLQTWVDLSHFFSDVDDLADVYYDAVHYHDYRAEEIAEEIAVHVRRVLAKPVMK
ncbi:MAG: hypothetical protein HN838_02020 [Rhodospirillaceae bacterium]|jgi:hypothetical protein|nr:hypothetical protein [Rhodospirillaceae bacterium]